MLNHVKEFINHPNNGVLSEDLIYILVDNTIIYVINQDWPAAFQEIHDLQAILTVAFALDRAPSWLDSTGITEHNYQLGEIAHLTLIHSTEHYDSATRERAAKNVKRLLINYKDYVADHVKNACC